MGIKLQVQTWKCVHLRRQVSTRYVRRYFNPIPSHFVNTYLPLTVSIHFVVRMGELIIHGKLSNMKKHGSPKLFEWKV